MAFFLEGIPPTGGGIPPSEWPFPRPLDGQKPPKVGEILLGLWGLPVLNRRNSIVFEPALVMLRDFLLVGPLALVQGLAASAVLLIHESKGSDEPNHANATVLSPT